MIAAARILYPITIFSVPRTILCGFWPVYVCAQVLAACIEFFVVRFFIGGFAWGLMNVTLRCDPRVYRGRWNDNFAHNAAGLCFCYLWFFCQFVSIGCIATARFVSVTIVNLSPQACVTISEHPMANDQSLGEIVSITQVHYNNTSLVLNP